MRPLLLVLLCCLCLSSFAWAANTHGLPSDQAEQRAWWGDALAPYVVAGCLPSVPVSSLTFGAFACTAYVRGASTALVYVAQTAAGVGPLSSGDGTYFLAVHVDLSTVVSGWTRQGGTQYLWKQASSQPSDPSGALVVVRVTVSGSVITAVHDVSSRSPTTTVLDAARYGGASAGAKIKAAIAALPTQGGIVDARKLTGTQTLDVDMYAGVPQTMPVTVLFGPGLYSQSATQTLPMYSKVLCDTNGGVPADSSSAHQGTIFQWTGATATTMWKWFNTTHAWMQGCVFDAQSTSGVLPLVLDGTNSPGGNLHRFENFTVENFTGIGFTWGTSGGTSNYQNDTVVIRQAMFRGFNNSSQGIVINSANTQNSALEQLLFQVVNVGIYVQWTGGWTGLRNISCGTLQGTTPTCIKIGFADQLSISDSEQDAVGPSDTVFMSFTGANQLNGCTVLQNLYLGWPIYVHRNACIVSIGLIGPSQAVTVAGTARITSLADHIPWFDLPLSAYPQTAYTGWVTNTTSQIFKVGQLQDIGASYTQFPITLDSGATHNDITQILLRQGSVGGAVGLSLDDYAAGGFLWRILNSNGSTPVGQLLFGNTANGTFPLAIDPNVANKMLRITQYGPQILASTGANLGAALDGTLRYCDDCQVTSGADNTCTSGGSGAFALRVNGAWRCFATQN